MKIKSTFWSPSRPSRVVSRFLSRPAFDPAAELAAEEVLAAIRTEGDRAVQYYTQTFQGIALTAARLSVDDDELAAAVAATPPAVKRAVREAHRRVTAFSRASMRPNWRMPTPQGGTMGEQFVPFDRVGVYVPGGAAPLASTSIMTATLAQVAGVPEIVACTPCDPEGQINPVLLYALKIAGATEIYRVGGIQGIGMLAYGTQSVRPVDKIVGPGGPYVTAAKRQVYGYTALDLVAGPSEIAVLADGEANPAWVAADLLSQAEHGSGHEKVLLVTDSDALAAAVAGELVTQGRALSRWSMIEKVLKQGTLLVTVDSLDDGMELCNRFAPEHFEIIVKRADRWLKRVRCAGAVFLGPWTPEPAGDFVAGPSHVLPTGGAARMFSGLTVEDFRRRSSFMRFTRKDLAETLPVIEAFGAIEGLDGHARSAQIRFEKGNP